MHDGKALNKLVKDKGWTRAELGVKIGVSQQMASKHTRTESFQPETMSKICNALEISESDFRKLSASFDGDEKATSALEAENEILRRENERLLNKYNEAYIDKIVNERVNETNEDIQKQIDRLDKIHEELLKQVKKLSELKS